MSASFAEAPNCPISKGLSIKIFFYFRNRFNSLPWLRTLYPVEQKKIKRVYVRCKIRIYALISQFQWYIKKVYKHKDFGTMPHLLLSYLYYHS